MELVRRMNLADEDKEMATLLNEYFSSVFNKETSADDITDTSDSEIRGVLMEEIKISQDDVKRAISEFKTNKSPGIDSITSTYALKIKDIIAHPLQLMFNRSLEVNEVPLDWKRANVTPIFKKGNKCLVENYRPISLTVIFGKVMEKILKKKIEKFASENNIIKNTQHGFTKGRSCLTNLLISQHSIGNMMDEGKAVDVIYLDFQKAFDKVPHVQLMKKIRNFGIHEKIRNWIKNWLTGREQRVVINGTSSDWVAVTSGVPQGSILGPLLFTLFIDDIDNGIKNLILKSADDTKMWGSVSSEENIVKMHEDLEKLSNWSKENKMPFNVSKCKVIHIGKKNPREVHTLNGQNVADVKEEKDLGIMATSTFKPSLNCDKVSKSANKVVGLIRRNVVNKSSEGMLTLYKTLIRPILDYCIPAWRPYFKRDIENLEKVQKRFTKMIVGCKDLKYDQRLIKLGK